MGAVLVEAVLFPGLDSVDAVEAVALLTMMAPVAPVLLTTETMVKVAVSPSVRAEALSNDTSPLEPTAGNDALHPAGAMADTKATSGGRLSLTLTPAASHEPLLVTWIV